MLNLLNVIQEGLLITKHWPPAGAKPDLNLFTPMKTLSCSVSYINLITLGKCGMLIIIL